MGTTVSNGDKRLQALQELTPENTHLVLTALRAETLSRCATDGLFWLQFVSTRDEADPEHTVKPIPAHKEYLRSLWAILATQQRIVIAKSRQMIVSWLLCAFCAWWARFHPNQYVVWQSQKKEDADKMISLAGGESGAGFSGRVQFLEHHLPPWMRVKLRETEGKLSYPNGSLIEAVAGGANQIRGKVPSVIVEDEFAYQEEAAGVYQAVAPLIQKAVKFIAVSTPNGAGNTFYQLYHGVSASRG